MRAVIFIAQGSAFPLFSFFMLVDFHKFAKARSRAFRDSSTSQFFNFSRKTKSKYIYIYFVTRIYFPASGQAAVTGIVPSPPRLLPSIFIAHRVQQSHCSSIFHRMLLTHALALSARQFVRKKKSPRSYTSMYSGGFELTKLTYTRLEDNLTRHRGDRQSLYTSTSMHSGGSKPASLT